jgi:hypothetical protein
LDRLTNLKYDASAMRVSATSEIISIKENGVGSANAVLIDARIICIPLAPR